MDIINDPAIDAVLVCSPTPIHADIAIAAMKAGKHVFCEKPVDLTIEKIQKTAEVAKETGRKLQIGFNRRFDHNHGRVQRLAADGTLGRIELIKITSRDPEPPSPEYAASSGGLYIDMMIHDFDMAMFLAGCDVKEVYATGTSLVDPRIGDMLMDFGVLRLRYGESFRDETPLERAFLLVYGKVCFQWDDGEHTEYRENCFDVPPTALHVRKGTKGVTVPA